MGRRHERIPHTARLRKHRSNSLGRVAVTLSLTRQSVPHIERLTFGIDAHKPNQLARSAIRALAANRAMHVERQPIRTKPASVGVTI